MPSTYVEEDWSPAKAQWIHLCLPYCHPQVRIPSTPPTLLSFKVFVLYVSCEKNENKQREVVFGPFLRKDWSFMHGTRCGIQTADLTCKREYAANCATTTTILSYHLSRKILNFHGIDKNKTLKIDRVWRIRLTFVKVSSIPKLGIKFCINFWFRGDVVKKF